MFCLAGSIKIYKVPAGKAEWSLEGFPESSFNP